MTCDDLRQRLLQASVSCMATRACTMTAAVPAFLLFIGVCGLRSGAAAGDGYGLITAPTSSWWAGHRFPAQQSRRLTSIGGSPSADVSLCDWMEAQL